MKGAPQACATRWEPNARLDRLCRLVRRRDERVEQSFEVGLNWSRRWCRLIYGRIKPSDMLTQLLKVIVGDGYLPASGIALLAAAFEVGHAGSTPNVASTIRRAFSRSHDGRTAT